MKRGLIINIMELNLTEKEEEVIRKLDTPAKIQDFLSAMPCNFEDDGGGETCLSPRRVLERNKCHCIEGAFFAAACIWINKIGEGKPLIVDMVGEKGDWDHVIAVFKIGGKWGAISKTNHSVLRYRDAVYDSIRELVMSYFNEYTDDKGKGRKTLRSYSDAVDLSDFGKEWVTSGEDLWHIHDFLEGVKHYNILTKEQIKNLRNQEQIEIDAGQLRQFCRKK
jgi:hypothetical protein